MFRVPNVVIWNWFSTLVASVVLGLKNVVKIRPKHFLVVLIRSDKNCTSKSVSMFWPLNRVISDRFSTLPTEIDPGAKKVIKIWPKHFSVILMGMDKNYVLNSVGKFRVQNQVIRAGFSTFYADVTWPIKVVKIRPKHFPIVLTENDKKCTRNCVCFGCQM